MPFCLGCGALFFPRLVLLALFVFSDYLEQAIHSGWWILLGFVFLPLTTMTYAWIVHTNGVVEGLYFVPLILAVLVDVGLIGSSRSRKKSG